MSEINLKFEGAPPANTRILPNTTVTMIRTMVEFAAAKKDGEATLDRIPIGLLLNSFGDTILDLHTLLKYVLDGKPEAIELANRIYAP